MKAPEDKALPYTLVVIVVAIVVYVVIATIIGARDAGSDARLLTPRRR